MRKILPAAALLVPLLSACISTDNPVIDALGGVGGTPDIVQCGELDDVQDGKDYVPQDAALFASDGRLHPDVFYIGWSKLDERNDLRFPTRGYAGDGFEDKLLVSRELEDGTIRSWQLLPMLSETCEDEETIRIHSFDVAPDGRSLYVSMRRSSDTHLAIYEFDFRAYTFRRITSGGGVDFLNPTYVGDDEETGRPILFVSKTVNASEIPLNYGGSPGGVLLDEYDRAATTLIHRLDAETGDVQRIGLNNSHQLDPLSITRADGTRLVVFTQWEHQATTNRFSLWKMQVDGSDNFTFFGQESATDRSAANVFQARAIESGPYEGYILMTQGRQSFVADGSVMMTHRENLDLRSERIALEPHDSTTKTHIARNPDHYNDQSMVYAYRETKDHSYGIYLKDYPADLEGDTTAGARTPLMVHDDMHFVQPRSFFPPQRLVTAPGEGTIGESRTSFTNTALSGRAGFLVQDLTQSDNGVQHQLDGIDPQDIRLQFFVPSHTFSGSQGSQAVGRLGWSGSPELSVPASGFLQPETDGSLGVVLKPGLYTWKMNKRFDHLGTNIWIPVRAERHEISFVPDRVNACNQCHQERSQANIDLYEDKESLASEKMQSDDLSAVTDISAYPSSSAVPDFHDDIMPLLSGCAGCHDARDQLDLSNPTGWRSQNATWLNLVRGGHKIQGTEEVVPYIYNSINPTGFDDDYHPAPFLWSLLLGDDLSVAPETGFADGSSRVLTRSGDYGATYDARIETAIADINTQFDHTGAWTAEQLQAFITYSSTQSMVGLSDRISFTADSLSTSSAAGQKAYQAMVRECFDCHNNHTSGGIDDADFGLPLEKRFRSTTDLKQSHLRFVVDSHKANKPDTAYSAFVWQSNLDASMQNTLRSALDRIHFDDPDESQLLVFGRCDGLHDNVSHPHCLVDSDPDYLAIENWVDGDPQGTVNLPPTLDGNLPAITIEEYADPAFVGPISWTDPDNELSQLFIDKPASSEHTFNDSMLALDYESFTAASVQTYAILGDRGDRELEFVVSDGQANPDVQIVPVTVTSDYLVPQPVGTLPDFEAFYTVRDTGELRRIDAAGNDQSIGFIDGYSPNFTTVYRRADPGWLYFVNQTEQRIVVVDESDATVVFTISLDHEPNKDSDTHRQTVYLIWWRPAERDQSGNLIRAGELQGLLESRLGRSNGDFYVGLGDGEPASTVVVPEYRNRIVEADNAVSVYVWRRATFMTQIVGNGIDRLNALNLVTGKAKNLGDFSFAAKTYLGVDYVAQDYFNVRAVLLSEDGAFYGFNQDLNSAPTLFNFDPLEGVQVEVPLPTWLEDLLNDPVTYGTPFVVVPPHSL